MFVGVLYFKGPTTRATTRCNTRASTVCVGACWVILSEDRSSTLVVLAEAVMAVSPALTCFAVELVVVGRGNSGRVHLLDGAALFLSFFLRHGDGAGCCPSACRLCSFLLIVFMDVFLPVPPLIAVALRHVFSHPGYFWGGVSCLSDVHTYTEAVRELNFEFSKGHTCKYIPPVLRCKCVFARCLPVSSYRIMLNAVYL